MMKKRLIISLGVLFAIGLFATPPTLSCRKGNDRSKEMTTNAAPATKQSAKLPKEEKKYIGISAIKAPIFVNPDVKSELIAYAANKDVFELMGERPEWYEIDMFSGEYRFVSKADAVPTEFSPTLPDDGIQDRVWEELGKAEDRSIIEADKKYSPDKDMMKNIDYSRVLQDRFKLEIFHKYRLAPPIHGPLTVKGALKRVGK